jgi:hypothetical protein
MRSELARFDMATIKGTVKASDAARGLQTKLNQSKAALIDILVERQFGARY